jgi:hypothetical protein
MISFERFGTSASGTLAPSLTGGCSALLRKLTLRDDGRIIGNTSPKNGSRVGSDCSAPNLAEPKILVSHWCRKHVSD